MKLKSFLRRVGIVDSDFAKIKTAVMDAEKNTTGEIAVAIAKQSHSYSVFEMFWALGGSILVFIGLIFFTDSIYSWLSRFSWAPSIASIPIFFILVFSLVYFLLFFIFNIPAVDRFIIPRKNKAYEVYSRALQHFVESGVYKTKDRSGVLIFISVLERRVVILADEGINAKIEQNQWKEICDRLTTSIKNKATGDGLCKAIEECGELLSKNFPAKDKNPNELSDGLVVLDF